MAKAHRYHFEGGYIGYACYIDCVIFKHNKKDGFGTRYLQSVDWKCMTTMKIKAFPEPNLNRFI